MAANTAQVSVLLVAGPLRARLGRGLRALAAQPEPERMEVVIVDLHPGSPPLEIPAALRARIVAAGGFTYGAARVEALRCSSAPLVAYLEDHVVPHRDWLDGLLSAFQTDADVVNFSFQNLNPDTITSKGCMLLAYGHWMAPMPAGAASFVACHNIAYRRVALEPFLNDLEDWLETEFYLHYRMREQRRHFIQSSGAVLAHENWTRLGDACRDSGAFQQLFGSQRAHLGRWGAFRRVFYAAAMPLCPPLHCWRLARRLWRRGPLFLDFLVSLPVIFTVYAYGSWREAAGYLFGEQNSRLDLTRIEFEQERE